jgi:orotidine-5'-phosphate decarboxylase|tara:strand:+ start:1978 stop:2712 length:735 start_codon:yes stop_codon:yes gene_type:complete
MTKFSNRIKKSSSNSSIILANDYGNNIPKLESKTIQNIKSLHEYLCGIKINFHLLLKLGKKEIQKINKTANDYGLQTIADIKLNDIGNTNLITIENLWELGFDAVIVNPIMGNQSLKNLVKNAHKKSKGVISLCHMSAPEARAIYELNVVKQNSSKITPLYQIFLDSAIKNNSDGIVVGATYPDIIKFCKKKAGKKLQIYSPGVGTQGGNAYEAKKLGSDFLIVGRSILNTKNPIETAKKLSEN